MYIMNILYTLLNNLLPIEIIKNILAYVRVYVPILIDEYELYKVKMRKEKHAYEFH